MEPLNAKTVLQAWFAYRKLSGLTMEQPAGPSPCAHKDPCMRKEGHVCILLSSSYSSR